MTSMTMISDREPTLASRRASEYAYSVYSHVNGKAEMWHGGDNSRKKIEAYFLVELCRMQSLIDDGDLYCCTIEIRDQDNDILKTETLGTSNKRVA